MEWRAVDHVAIFASRISNATISRDSKIAARDEHLRKAEELGREIEHLETKLAAWAEIEDDFRRAAEEEGEIHLLNPPKPQGAVLAAVVAPLPAHTLPAPKRRIRGTKEKVIAFYKSLNGAEFSIDDVVRAIHAENSDVPRDSIGSILSSLKTHGFLDNTGFGRYQEPGVAHRASSFVSAPSLNTDLADDFWDDFGIGAPTNEGGEPDE